MQFLQYYINPKSYNSKQFIHTAKIEIFVLTFKIDVLQFSSSVAACAVIIREKETTGSESMAEDTFELDAYCRFYQDYRLL